MSDDPIQDWIAAYHRELKGRIKAEARLAEAEEKRIKQLQQQGDAWAADVARYKARLTAAEALLSDARNHPGDPYVNARINAFLAPAEPKHQTPENTADSASVESE